MPRFQITVEYKDGKPIKYWVDGKRKPIPKKYFKKAGNGIVSDWVE